MKQAIITTVAALAVLSAAVAPVPTPKPVPVKSAITEPIYFTLATGRE